MTTAKNMTTAKKWMSLHKGILTDSFPLASAPKLQQSISWIRQLDIALLLTVLLLLLTDAKVFYFHLVFILLTFGAFYWSFRAFMLRSSLAVGVTTTALIGFVWVGALSAEELIEIPMLTMILLLVFGIAGRRAKADEALRKINEDLENCVAVRTADLLAEVTERRQTEQTLRESEERYRRLVELSFEAVAIHRDGRFLYINPAGVQFFGAARQQDLLDKSLFDLVHPDSIEEVQTRLQQIKRETRGAPLAEKKFMRLDGAGVDVEAVTIPITYQGHPAMQTVFRDITARKQAEQARLAERTNIARDLHDSLGQSLGYLHLKLDEIVECTAMSECSTFEPDFIRMRDVANDAYEQVRNMLASLLPANTTKLTTSLRALASMIGHHAQFKVQVITFGCEECLSPVLQQQVISICREALTNVARHAQAQQVKICLTWVEAMLTMTIVDDGCGFDATAPRAVDSFGLKIMEDRAAQMNGMLGIQSTPGQGTQLTLQIPLPQGHN